MKKLLIKFKVSRSLDTGAPLSSLWRRWISGSPELEQFSQAARDLDEQLKQRADAPEPAAPPSLHSSIMRAVRASRISGRQAAEDQAGLGSSPALRWGLATALLLLAGTGTWLAFDHWGPPGGQGVRHMDVTALPAVGPLAEQITTNGLAMLTLPMAEQMEDLSRNVRETAQFLLASLP